MEHSKFQLKNQTTTFHVYVFTKELQLFEDISVIVAL
jgi:hypothetical protein